MVRRVFLAKLIMSLKFQSKRLISRRASSGVVEKLRVNSSLLEKLTVLRPEKKSQANCFFKIKSKTIFRTGALRLKNLGIFKH